VQVVLWDIVFAVQEIRFQAVKGKQIRFIIKTVVIYVKTGVGAFSVVTD